jgi:hypothetical protein
MRIENMEGKCTSKDTERNNKADRSRKIGRNAREIQQKKGRRRGEEEMEFDREVNVWLEQI